MTRIDDTLPVRKMADKLARFPPHVREGFSRVTRVPWRQK
jgi:hypothetical protein